VTIFYSIVTVKTACDLELPSFIKVALVYLCVIPVLSRRAHSSAVETSMSLRPLTDMTPFFSSLIESSLSYFPVCLLMPGSNRSCSSSLYNSRKATLTLNSEYSAAAFRASSSSNMNLNTLGTIPTSSKGSPSVLPVPMECVLPDPVWPYASMVALKPWKHPSTRLRVHVSNKCSWESLSQKTLSKVKLLLPIKSLVEVKPLVAFGQLSADEWPDPHCDRH